MYITTLAFELDHGILPEVVRLGTVLNDGRSTLESNLVAPLLAVKALS